MSLRSQARAAGREDAADDGAVLEGPGGGGRIRDRKDSRRGKGGAAARAVARKTLALLDAGVLHDATVRRLQDRHGFAWVSCQELTFGVELPSAAAGLSTDGRAYLAAVLLAAEIERMKASGASLTNDPATVENAARLALMCGCVLIAHFADSAARDAAVRELDAAGVDAAGFDGAVDVQIGGRRAPAGRGGGGAAAPAVARRSPARAPPRRPRTRRTRRCVSHRGQGRRRATTSRAKRPRGRRRPRRPPRGRSALHGGGRDEASRRPRGGGGGRGRAAARRAGLSRATATSARPGRALLLRCRSPRCRKRS